MANVRLSIVWTEYTAGESVYETEDALYFVYADDGSCVAAIFIMGTVNLHVFVKAKNRRQGVMTRALRDIVLPHLFTSNRKYAISHPRVHRGTRNAEMVGFAIHDKTNAVI